jgi:hypothetical protein
MLAGRFGISSQGYQDMFAPEDRFISDYWVLREGADYHLFPSSGATDSARSWWQGYKFCWKDWMQDHEMTKPPCLCNDPRPVRLEWSEALGFRKIVIGREGA